MESNPPRFSMCFEIKNHTYQEMQDAFLFYQKAFGAKKLKEFFPYQSDENNLHIIMEIHGIDILLHPGGDDANQCGGSWEFEREDVQGLQNAINVLSKDARSVRMESWPHWPITAFIVDKYGVSWALHN
ncbi:MAG: hypothetical protein IJD82_05640 [Clostridia bacterium]|nr:hypothetical protein [Clostridia bacterium]